MPTRVTKEAERRLTPRMDLHLPINFRPVLNSTRHEEKAQSLNISRRGVYLATALPVTAGMAVELQFTMPEEITGKPERAWRCVGRVVRVDKRALRWGRCGVGIQFDYYELVPLSDAN
jgi:hypothetical protein